MFQTAVAVIARSVRKGTHPVQDSVHRYLSIHSTCSRDLWSDSNPLVVISVFQSRSCSPGHCSQRSNIAPAHEVSVTCLHRSSTTWDDTNEIFIDSLAIKEARRGYKDISEVQHDTSGCFSLIWFFEDRLSRNVWSTDAT